MSFHMTVAADLSAPAIARRALTDWLSTRTSDGLLSDAPLVVSELVTNSLLHASPQEAAEVRVSAVFADGVLRIEVEDGGTGGGPVRRSANRDLGGGFGLNIVNSLAAHWGVERNGSTLVWVELAC
jgi:serine/threonine-protein kinase RsbW